MSFEIQGMQFNPPQTFVPVDFSVTLQAPAVKSAQAKHPITPNIILQRRTVPTGGKLENYTGELTAEVITTVKGAKEMTTEQFNFNDGVAGAVIGFTLQAMPGMAVRQMQAVRLDDTQLTTLTMTVDVTRFNEDSRKEYLATLASMVPSN